MKWTFYLSLCFLLLGSACKTARHQGIGKKTTIAKPSVAAQAKEYNLFFQSENARLFGDKNEAYRLYASLVKQFPNNAVANYNYARVLFQRKDLVLAEQHAHKALDLNEANKYYREFYVQLLVYNRKLKQAETQYQAMLEREPRNQEYIYELALVYLKAGNTSKSLEMLAQLEKLMGFNEDIALQKKTMYLQNGQVEEAIGELRKLQQQDRNNVEYPMMMIDIYEGSKHPDKASIIYNELAKSYASNPMAQIALAEYYQKKNDTASYRSYMLQLMQNKNVNTETKMSLLAPMLQNMEADTSSDSQFIVEMARQISLQSPDNKDAKALLADMLFMARQYSDALIEYKNYLRMDSSKLVVWNQIMSLQFDAKAYDSVIHTATHCIRRFPDNAFPYFYQGISFQQTNQVKLAIPAYQQAIARETKNKTLLAQLYANLGDAFHTEKQFAQSDSSFEKSIELQPDEATVLNNYAYYLSLRKINLAKAEQMSKKSLTLQPDSKSFLDTYGWIRYEQGFYQEALMYIEKAIQHGGEDDPTLFDHLGDVYEKLGDKEKAIKNWELARQKGDASEELLKKLNNAKNRK